MEDLITIVRDVRRDAEADAAKLASIDAQASGIDPDAIARVRARIERRQDQRAVYLGNLVAQLRDFAGRVDSDVEAMQSQIDGERTNIDEIRLLRRVGEITQADAEPRIAAARAAVQAARDRLAVAKEWQQRIAAELANHPQPKPEPITP